MNKLAAALTTLVVMVICTSMATAATHTIQNQTLFVTYDDVANTFSVTDKASGLVFLKDGKLAGTAPKRVLVGPLGSDSWREFGSGQAITIDWPTDGETNLMLFDGIPFVFIDGMFCNPGEETMDVRNLVPATFALDLGKPANDLRTMGSGGLTAPDKNPGSYLFLTLADPATRRGVVAGWLTNDCGCGVLFSDVQNDKVQLRAQIDYGHLRIAPFDGRHKALRRSQRKLETLVVGLFDDARLGEEQFADAVAKHYQIKLHPQVSGYCTWYSDQHNGAGDEKSIVELAEVVAKELKPFGFSFVQIDDKWQGGGKFTGPRRGFEQADPNGPYPHGIKPVAEKIDALGLTTGLWFMPFSRNYQDDAYKDRKHWFVKRKDGTLYDDTGTELEWGGTSLDLTHPEVQQYLAKVIKDIGSWGVNYVKMDGLFTGLACQHVYVNEGYKEDHFGDNAPFHDPSKTNVEAYRDGLKLLRKAAGPDMFFSGCCACQNMRSFGASIGFVDSMRIGPDNGRDWLDFDADLKNYGGSLISGPIRGGRLFFLNGRVWWNDPDPFYVRNELPLNHVLFLTSWVALSGQFQLNSDWIPGLSAERLDIIKRIIPAHGVTARPVDYFDSNLPRIWLVTDTRRSVRRDVLGVFNWENQQQAIGCAAAWAGLDPTKNYHAFDFWANRPAPSFCGDFKFDVPGRSCRVIAVRSAEDHPVLASTSRHVTQGIIDVADEQWNASSGELRGVSTLVGNDHYELRIAGLNDGGKWQLASVSVSADDKSAGVAIEPKAAVADEDGWLRIAITSPQSRDVHWTVKFKR